MELDPRRLLTFREVARLRSFSRAAEALSLTQPAVSQQVAALERQLGVRLLERGPGGPTLTHARGLLLQHADPLASRALVASGVAVTLLPRLLRDELPGVAVIPLTGDVPVRRLYAVTPA